MKRIFGPPTDSNSTYLTKCIHNSLLFEKGITPVYSHVMCSDTRATRVLSSLKNFTFGFQLAFLCHRNSSLPSDGYHESEAGAYVSTVWFWTFSHKHGMVPSSHFLHEHWQCVAWGCYLCCIHAHIQDTSAFVADGDRPVENHRLLTQALEVQAMCISSNIHYTYYC